MRGRKPKPSTSNIKPKVTGFPDPPSVLSGAARLEWERIRDQMEGQLIGALDVAVLKAYCNTVDRIDQMNEKIAELPDITFDTKGGAKMFSFLMSAIAKHEAHLSKLASELGLTPLSRTRLSASGPPAAKPVAPSGPVKMKIAQ